jgi:hypothetical protein
MDQLSSMQNPELPKPELLPKHPDGVEAVTPLSESNEKLTSAQSERLSQASTAVSQATDDLIVLPSVSTDNVHNQAINDSSVLIINTDHINEINEKEWVKKAKEIVETNKDDPGSQSDSVLELRHDYMSKRFGKNIKLPNERITNG